MFWSSAPKAASVPLPSDPTIRRSFLDKGELLERPSESLRTVGDIFAYSAKKHGKRTACFTRDVLDVVEETKSVPKAGGGTEDKVWKYFTLSKPAPVTYIELDNLVSSVHAGLVSLGFTDPSSPLASRARVSIYADTSLSWQLMAQAFARSGHVVTTAYTTLGPEGLLQSLDEPEVELVFCGEAQAGMVGKVLERAGRVKWVVVDNKGKQADQAALDAIKKTLEARGGRLITLEELKQLGSTHSLTPDQLTIKPGPDDLFCIMYTSGSTGKPKGVMLSHGNVIASLAGSCKLWEKGFHAYSDVLLAYLPLAHILEVFLEYTMYILGVQVAYGSVKTLLDDNVRGCKGDLRAYQPTLLAGVPAVWEMIRKGMMKKISEAPALVGTVFSLAVSGKQNLPWPLNAAIDRVLFARVKAATGGRLRLGVCGGGALSKDTQLFLSTVLAPLIQGYGLTESVGMTTICTPDFMGLSHVGVLGPSCEVKLQDQPDYGYTNAKTPPTGEIWLRGPCVFKGYFKQEDLTRESMTEDGWFKTGDIGQWNENGTLSVIDRIKQLIKLSNGEYIALDRLESTYKACNVVMMLAIVAPPYADRPIAIVYPHEGNLRNHLRVAGLSDEGTPADWAHRPEVKNYILGRLREIAKRGGLQSSETIRDVILTEQEWSPDNGMLTAAMKIARPYINTTYDKEIKTAYGQ